MTWICYIKGPGPYSGTNIQQMMIHVMIFAAMNGVAT